MAADRTQAELAGRRLLRALCNLDSVHGRKTGFRPDQPRVPAGQPDGGEWGGDNGHVVLVGGGLRTFVPVRVGNRALAATPRQADQLAYATARAQQALEQVRQYEPRWRPNDSLRDPNSIEGAIRTAEAEAVEAEARLRELLRYRGNGGPPLDPLPAPPGQGSSIPLPPICIATYRDITGMPDIGNRLAYSRADGTVAFTSVDGRPVFGINSKSPGYTVEDSAAAQTMRDRLIAEYPDIMNTADSSWKPNDAVYHAEGNTLMRAAERTGGSLAGRTIEMRVDRKLCESCKTVLPYIGLQLGNPTVRMIDSSGVVRTFLNGGWVD
jgi:hypothetical protein